MTASFTDIKNKVKRLITMPIDDTLINDDDFLNFINDCLLESIFPRLMKIRDDYGLTREVFNLQDSSGQDLYLTGIMPIPPRAWGNTLREVRYIDVSGNLYKMTPYFLSDVDLYVYKNLAFSATWRKGFIPNNSGIQLIPPPKQDPGSIEMYYILTPSAMIESSTPGDYYATITNIQFNSSTNVATYTIGSVDAEGALNTIGINDTNLYDVYNRSTGMILAQSIALTRTASLTYTGICTVQTGTNIISPNIQELTNFQAGGYPVLNTYAPELYLTFAGISPFTTVPSPIDNLLYYEVAMKVLSAIGDFEQLQVMKAEHDERRKDILSQMAMRVECEPYIISNKRGVRTSVIYGGRRTGRV